MLKIDTDSCMGCGVCEANCPFDALYLENGVINVNEKCTLCGSCVDLCELGALSIARQSRKDIDLTAFSGVWVFAESRHGRIAPVSFELLGAGRRLADQRQTELTAVLLGFELGDQPQKLICQGADRVLVADDPALAEFIDETYANVLEDAARLYKPEVILAGATAIGRSFIPLVATRLETGLTADCTGLDIRNTDGALLQTRPAFGGNVMATIVCPYTRPQMATVRPLVMRSLEPDANRQGETVILELKKKRLQSLVKVIESVAGEADKVNLTEADIVVAGGRGMENAKGFALIHELADCLGGGVAASRAAVDSGLIPYAHQVGQTGKTVCPKVYIACGISGAIQHLVGMQSAETIIAINKDSEAPIFDIATYGIVGDAFEIIPQLIQEIKQNRG